MAKLVATALIQPLDWEPPYITGVALKRQKKKKNPIAAAQVTGHCEGVVGSIPGLCDMEVARLGVESELQLPAYTTARAIPELHL